MRDVVLWVESGGLGDHLIYSTIPERFARLGRRVYIARSTPTRNDEVRSLLYEENPFVAGWTDEAPNAGTAHAEVRISERHSFRSIIEWVEAAHGLDPTSLYPRIYYSPRFRADLSKVVLIDPRSTSQPFPAKRFDEFVARLKISREHALVVESSNSGPHGSHSLREYQRIGVKSLHDYIDMIYSCLVYVGTESGGSALASAVRQHSPLPYIYALTTTKNFNHGVYIFPNVKYTVIGGLQADW